MARNSAQHQDAFGNLVDFLCRVIIHLLELTMQYEKRFAFDVPVKSSQIGIIYLEIGQ